MARKSLRNIASKAARNRCAIYTRKSSEEGLEQAFNSLDAQREACEAFISSQKHEGWTCLEEMYDDGGISGATMERPALKRLLADIEAGQVDVVIVYKVDRLTRSLADFVKIVEVFDDKQVSFVSVTQQFNTTTSMGRLTLNVLLSFAQFEREVTGERIRDKIAASKKKGLWMGGQPPLGYDVKDKKLIVNQAEAETVRHIFGRYVRLQSVRMLRAELDAAGIVSKTRKARDGTSYGAKPLARGALYHLLQNHLYRGEIMHKETAYPGEHDAIIDPDLWDAVQSVLAANRVGRANGTWANEPSLLAGLLYDPDGEPMTPTHAVKKGKRYRYYVSRSLNTGSRKNAPKGMRIPAVSLEVLVSNRIRDWLADPVQILNAVGGGDHDAVAQRSLMSAAAKIASTWGEQSPDEIRCLVVAIVVRVQVQAASIEISLDETNLAKRLTGMECSSSDADRGFTLLSIPARLRRAGIELRMVVTGDHGNRVANVHLIQLLIRASRLRERLQNDRDITLKEIAYEDGVAGSYVTRLLRLNYLAPDIVSAIIAGDQPPELTARRLMDNARLPLTWPDQRSALGFD